MWAFLPTSKQASNFTVDIKLSTKVGLFFTLATPLKKILITQVKGLPCSDTSCKLQGALVIFLTAPRELVQLTELRDTHSRMYHKE